MHKTDRRDRLKERRYKHGRKEGCKMSRNMEQNKDRKEKREVGHKERSA